MPSFSSSNSAGLKAVSSVKLCSRSPKSCRGGRNERCLARPTMMSDRDDMEAELKRLKFEASQQRSRAASKGSEVSWRILWTRGAI